MYSNPKITTKALRERKLCQGQNLTTNLDVYQIAPIMYWIHSVVGLSHFIKYCLKIAVGDCV